MKHKKKMCNFTWKGECKRNTTHILEKEAKKKKSQEYVFDTKQSTT